MPKMRLDKLLSHLNCGSRKEVQSFIRAGRVAVNGTAERDPAAKVDPDADRVSLDGREQTYRAQRYYMLNKPAGVITASRDERHGTVLELFPESLRRGLFAVGRLDKDTEGLLLVTDDGALSHALMSPSRHVSKVYEAELDGVLVPDAAERFGAGLTLRDGTVCRPALLELLPEPKAFLQELNALGIPGVVTTAVRTEKCGICGTQLSVTVNGAEEESEDVPLAHTHACSHVHDTATTEIYTLSLHDALPI